jgi:hypothetical protein
MHMGVLGRIWTGVHHYYLRSLANVGNDFLNSPPQHLAPLLLQSRVFWTPSHQVCISAKDV